MARKRIPMRKIKETLRLRFDCDLSERSIGRALNVPPGTVHDYLVRAKTAGLSWPLPEGLTDTELNRLLYTRPEQEPGQTKPVPDWRVIHQELARKYVTRQLLWEEYVEEHPDGYSYSRFCELYREWAKQLHPTMRLDHKAGEQAFVDYSGAKIPYIDPETGELLKAPLFVAVLGFSSYTFCEAHAAQDLGNWIAGHVNAFTYWDGVPEIAVPDNTKTGVTNPCRYEPNLNPTYHEMAMHYGVAIIPTRVRHPRDKAKVESAVLAAERRVMAPLRDKLFVGLGALNTAIREQREALNDRGMRHLGKSRRELFEEIDKPALKPLPSRPFETGVWKTARVAIDYHVQYEWHYYSVPYQLIHQEVEIRATVRTVEVFHNGLRICSHRRSSRRGGHTTCTEHMPKAHREYVEWTPERLVRWAEKTGPQTAKLVKAVMEVRDHPQQGFRSCLGIMRLAKDYPVARMEAAAQRALHYGLLSYKGLKRILESGLDGVSTEDEPDLPPAPPHANVRGEEYYQ